MRNRQGQEGYTLVELIVVISIIAILSTVMVMTTSILRESNPRNAANLLCQRMDKVRLNTMSKDTKQYLYLYKIDQSIYTKISSEADHSLALLDKDSGTKIAKDIVVTYQDTLYREIELNDSNYIRIFFTKSAGTFGSDVEYIQFSNHNKLVRITCIIETGRYLIE